jgi:hypothetical protein
LNVRLAAREALIAEALALSAPSPANAPGSTPAAAGQEPPLADAPGGTAESAVAEAHATPPPAADRVSAVRSLRTRWANAPVLPRDVLGPLAQRFEAALAAVVGADPDALRGTEFDVTANVRRLQELVARAESLAGPEPARREAVSPASILATQLREALAANTIGGRADDESKVRAAEQEIRHLQAAWTQVGFVPDTQARPLAMRFQRACQRFFDHREQRRRALAGKT